METYSQFHQQSIQNRDIFWAEEAKKIEWQKPFSSVCDYTKPPFVKWFSGGETNLCHNAVDRHLAQLSSQNALVWISTEVNQTRTFTYAQLHAEVNRCAHALKRLGVGKGDRVLIYMPMVPEAVFAMLATVRLGAIHSVVFGGFASVSLAARIDDAKPKVIVTSDAGSRGGKPIPLKPLVDQAVALSEFPPAHTLIMPRGLVDIGALNTPRDVLYANIAPPANTEEVVPCEWVESSHPSYILYTSGTTGKPKGVQRDTGGYAVALAASMQHIYDTKRGEAFFCTSDIGWVVGHSYIVYAPLINGSTTIMYEGLPVVTKDGKADASVWWKIVQDYKVRCMFSSPTAVRVLKKHNPAELRKYNVASLKYLFLAGEPLDEPTSTWIEQGLGVAVIDNYWQTETGWPILSAQPGVEATPRKVGSPSFPCYGYNVKLKNQQTGITAGANEKAVVCVVPPLPPGCMSTIWGDDKRFVETYFSSFEDELVYTTFDWGVRDDNGYYFILGRTDDVINVAGHRLGTREIEEAIQAHTNVAEVAVVGIADALKGQIPVAVAVLKNMAQVATPAMSLAHEKEIQTTVDKQLGAIGRPARIYFVTALPKTRSGKLLRRAIQALCENRDPGDLTTIEDATSLEQIRQHLGV